MEANLHRIVYWLWLGSFAVWAVSAIATKQAIGSYTTWQSRVAVWMVALAWGLLLDRELSGALMWRFVPMSLAEIYGGLALTLAGLGLALWARFHLGRNWSALVELKLDHKLVRSGPYAIVRHPIYSGFMLAALGTAVAFGELHGLISFALIVVAWSYKSRLEEAFLAKQFGAEYDRYCKEVKGLIPFVW
jgi:protein-S-isoprenylcysteine O-methyltransferase